MAWPQETHPFCAAWPRSANSDSLSGSHWGRLPSAVAMLSGEIQVVDVTLELGNERKLCKTYYHFLKSRLTLLWCQANPAEGRLRCNNPTQTRQMCPLVFICERPRMVFVALSLATNNWYKLTKLRSATLHSLSPTSFAVQPDMSAIVAMSLIALPKFLNRFKVQKKEV